MSQSTVKFSDVWTDPTSCSEEPDQHFKYLQIKVLKVQIEPEDFGFVQSKFLLEENELSIKQSGHAHFVSLFWMKKKAGQVRARGPQCGPSWACPVLLESFSSSDPPVSSSRSVGSSFGSAEAGPRTRPGACPSLVLPGPRPRRTGPSRSRSGPGSSGAWRASAGRRRPPTGSAGTASRSGTGRSRARRRSLRTGRSWTSLVLKDRRALERGGASCCRACWELVF